MKGEGIMITKEQSINKYCCLYVSEYHLEMILLPFIKNKIKESEILIFTQNSLLETLHTLLKKLNLSNENKNRIIDIKNWNTEKIDLINNEDVKEYTVIINGNKEYRDRINKKIEKFNINVKNIVDCYDVNNTSIKSNYIQNNYIGVLNTESI